MSTSGDQGATSLYSALLEQVKRPCHAGLRATRLAKDLADVAAHPGAFRCPVCRMLLDAPL